VSVMRVQLFTPLLWWATRKDEGCGCHETVRDGIVRMR
jgi:hypothetical protein